MKIENSPLIKQIACLVISLFATSQLFAQSVGIDALILENGKWKYEEISSFSERGIGTIDHKLIPYEVAEGVVFGMDNVPDFWFDIIEEKGLDWGRTQKVQINGHPEDLFLDNRTKIKVYYSGMEGNRKVRGLYRTYSADQIIVGSDTIYLDEIEKVKGYVETSDGSKFFGTTLLGVSGLSSTGVIISIAAWGLGPTGLTIAAMSGATYIMGINIYGKRVYHFERKDSNISLGLSGADYRVSEVNFMDVLPSCVGSVQAK